MFEPVRPVDVDLSLPLHPITCPEGYASAQILVRLHGAPLGFVTLPAQDGQVAVEALRQAILDELSWPLARIYLLGLVGDPTAGAHDQLDLVKANSPAFWAGPWPSVSVAVCTRNRAAELALCLDGLARLDYPGELEVLVVDNAPGDNSTERLLREGYPTFHYVREERPGLNWARNRAISASRGALIAFTDDDVVVDRLWARALARVFAENPAVMALTGLVAPYELETPAQLAFERYGGFGRGCEPRWFGVNLAGGERVAIDYLTTGKFGTGANMAYRREAFERMGAFDPALDVGTVSNGGGDLEIFFRVLKAGFLLAYEPRAIVRHRHRRDAHSFQVQIANNGVGFYAYLVRCFRHFPEERAALLHKGAWWFWYWYIYRLLLSLARPINTSRRLVLAEMRGALAGLTRYQQASRTALRLAGPSDLPTALAAPAQRGTGLRPAGIAVRVVELSAPIKPLADVSPYPKVRVFAQWRGRLLGSCTLTNCYQPIGAERLRQELVDQLGAAFLREVLRSDARTVAEAMLSRQPQPAGIVPEESPGLSREAAVSVVVVARGRPEDLDGCLGDLARQQGGRPVELIVVGQQQEARLSAAGWASIPGVRFVDAPGGGLLAGRRAGIAVATGDVVVCVDGDLRLPSSWLEELLAPLADPNVAASTGRVLPTELETRAQQLTARYEASDDCAPVATHFWLREDKGVLPGWAEGALSGAALRRSALAGSGWLEEAPSASGAGEDCYLLYRLQREGHRLAFAAQACAWRRYSRAEREPYRRAYTLCAGQLAWRLLALRRHRDGRPLADLARRLPRHYVKRMLGRLRAALRGGEREPVGLLVEEIRGLLAGSSARQRSAGPAQTTPAQLSREPAGPAAQKVMRGKGEVG